MTRGGAAEEAEEEEGHARVNQTTALRGSGNITANVRKHPKFIKRTRNNLRMHDHEGKPMTIDTFP